MTPHAANEECPAFLRRLVCVVIGIAVITSLAACRAVQRAADLPGDAVRIVVPGHSSSNSVAPVELQQKLMRFADDYSQRVSLSFEVLRIDGEPLSRHDILLLRLNVTRQIQQIASGQNALANLLDMVTVVVLSDRVALASDRVQLYGDSANQLRTIARRGREEVLALAREVLSADQMKELVAAIETHVVTSEDPRSAMFVRAINYVPTKGKSQDSKGQDSGSVFDLLRLDPLAGLSPATRELAETRLFAERALYVGQRTPAILRMETELTSLLILENKDVRGMAASIDRISVAADRLSQTAAALPSEVRAEREAVVAAVEAQTGPLTEMVREIERTMVATTGASSNLTETLKSFDALMKRFGVGEPQPPRDPSAPPSEPFRIEDYTETIAQANTTALSAINLLKTLDATLGSTNLTALESRANALVAGSDARIRDLIEWAFWRVVGMIVLVVGGVVLIIRMLRRRPSNPS